ncbi:MAG: CHASE domain-containing protein [Bacillota bacterium]
MAILLIGLVLTTIATEISVYEAKSDINKEFALICNEIKSVVSVRLHAHAVFLRSGAALFEASDSVTRHEFSIFYKHSKIDKNLPGIQGIAYSKLIAQSELHHHIESIRSEGFPDYTVLPQGERALYAPIIYIEPFSNRNLRAFGYDGLSEPVRRKAMELSCDSNLAVLSGKVRLVQETNEDVQAGTLMYVPVYRQGMPITTLEQRRTAIKGWVYSPYRMTNLMRGILGVRDSISHQRIRLQVYDNDTLNSKALLYDSQKKDTLAHKVRFSCEMALPIDFNGKHWILKFTQSNPQNLFLQGEALTVMLGGFVMSLLLFFLSFSLFNTRHRAQWIADKLTKELTESEAKFRFITESMKDVVYILDTHTLLYVYMSPSVEQVRGYTAEEVMAEPSRDSATKDKSVSLKNMIDQRVQEYWEDKKNGLPPRYYTTELEQPCKDGSTIWMEQIAHYYYNEKTTHVEIHAVSRDITQRKQAEVELKEKEASLRFAQKIANMGSWEFDIHTQKTNFSENYYNFFGFNPAEVVPSLEVFQNAIHPDDLSYFNDIVARVYSEKKQISFELRVIAKDNKVKWIFNEVLPETKDGVLVKLFGAFIDITERKQTEEALMAWNERFKKLSANAPGLIFQFTKRPDGSYYVPIASEGIRDIFGCTPEDVVDNFTAIGNVLYPEDAERVINDIEYSAKHLSAFTCEFRVQIPGKPIQWIYSKSNPEKLADGSITWYGFNTDITDHKQAEETISMLAHAIRSISECVSITDMDDNIIFVNRALLQTYNYEESELIGKHISIVRSPNNPSDIVQQILPSTLKGGWYGELLNIRKDGTEFPVFVSTSAICDEIGNPIALIGIAHDITEDKQAQAELLAVSQRLSSIMESTGDIIAMSDPDYHYILFNTAFHQESKRIFGKDIQAGDSMHDVLSHLPNDLEDALKHWKRALDGEDFIVVQQFGDTHLERHWYELHFSPVRNADEKVIGAVHIVRNITERKQTEEDMLEKNEELSNYLRIIAHDLRSPLVGLQGYAMRYGKQTETLKTILANCQLDAADKEQIDKITFEDMPKSLNAILISVDKMDVLINGLSKISNTGRATLIIKQVNMNHLFNAIVSTHNFQIDEHAAQINIAELPDCYGDENQLNQLFSNLMGNALKYHDASRPLVITVEGKINRNKVVYSITDTGIGISPRNLEKIWNVFFRVNPTSPIAGEGIGLSFVKRIADKHKGRIWAESTEGKGSTFFVELQQHEFSE